MGIIEQVFLCKLNEARETDKNVSRNTEIASPYPKRFLKVWVKSVESSEFERWDWESASKTKVRSAILGAIVPDLTPP